MQIFPSEGCNLIITWVQRQALMHVDTTNVTFQQDTLETCTHTHNTKFLHHPETYTNIWKGCFCTITVYVYCMYTTIHPIFILSQLLTLDACLVFYCLGMSLAAFDSTKTVWTCLIKFDQMLRKWQVRNLEGCLASCLQRLHFTWATRPKQVQSAVQFHTISFASHRKLPYYAYTYAYI